MYRGNLMMDRKPPAARNGVVNRVLATIGGISTGLAVLVGLAILFAITQEDPPITYRFPSPGAKIDAVVVIQSGGGAVSYCTTSVFITQRGAEPGRSEEIFGGDCHSIGTGPDFPMTWVSDELLTIRPVVGDSPVSIRTEVRGTGVKIQFII